MRFLRFAAIVVGSALFDAFIIALVWIYYALLTY